MSTTTIGRVLLSAPSVTSNIDQAPAVLRFSSMVSGEPLESKLVFTAAKTSPA